MVEQGTPVDYNTELSAHVSRKMDKHLPKSRWQSDSLFDGHGVLEAEPIHHYAYLEQ